MKSKVNDKDLVDDSTPKFSKIKSDKILLKELSGKEIEE